MGYAICHIRCSPFYEDLVLTVTWSLSFGVADWGAFAFDGDDALICRIFIFEDYKIGEIIMNIIEAMKYWKWNEIGKSLSNVSDIISFPKKLVSFFEKSLNSHVLWTAATTWTFLQWSLYECWKNKWFIMQMKKWSQSKGEFKKKKKNIYQLNKLVLCQVMIWNRLKWPIRIKIITFELNCMKLKI